MSTVNDENKKRIEEKYQKFKASQLNKLNILTSVDQNKI